MGDLILGVEPTGESAQESIWVKDYFSMANIENHRNSHGIIHIINRIAHMVKKKEKWLIVIRWAEPMVGVPRTTDIRTFA